MNAEPFTHNIAVETIPAAGKKFHIEADAAACRELAKALGLLEVQGLAADLDVRMRSGRAVKVQGMVRASVVQLDVVTLEPVVQEIIEPIDVTLVPEERSAPLRRHPVAAGPAGEDEPDTYRDGRIDLGALAVEHMALGLDPYPRAPGVEFAAHIEDDPAEDPSPFAVLAGLKRNDE